MPAPERSPDWLDELDLHVGPPDAAMGTRALDLDRWFVVDDDWEHQRAHAAELVRSHREDVVVGAADPAVLGPSREVLALVRRHAPTAGSGVPIPAHAGEPVGQNLVEARLLVADDLCVLLPEGDRWVLAAGCVCFPSYWRPADKVGHPLTDVHGRVPGYPGTLADRVDGFLSRLPPGRAVWRRNWLVHDGPELHVPERDATQARPEPEGRWLRSERQALVRLVDHEAVLFSIRTQQVPVGALAERPDACGALADALGGWSPAQRAYKGHAVDDALVAWLDRRRRG
jgi:dimethylamine monooxygenase subunit A